MEKPQISPRINRRVALQWISSAAVSLPTLQIGAEQQDAGAATGSGYGPDPDMIKVYQPGDLWPLTFSDTQRRLVTALCDIIIPADDTSPSASSVGVPDFVDEWISSPYPGQNSDRNLILKGLDHLESENFLKMSEDEQVARCTEMAIAVKSDRRKFPGSFFLRLRDLIAGGYYTTPEGMKDIGYRGNMAMPEWNGPPPEVLEKLGLSPQD